MSFFDIILDNVKPQVVKDLENLDKVGSAVQKFEKGKNGKNVEELQSIFKKGWIEKAEKQMKVEIGRLEAGVKSDPNWPSDKIDAYEAKVLDAFKKENKKGLKPVDCKQTIAAIRVLLKEIDRHQKDMKDIAANSAKAISIVAKMETDYKKRKDYAAELAKSFKTLTKSSFVLPAMQAEMLTYYLHCEELKKLFSEAESLCVKLRKRIGEDAKEAKERADMAKDQYQYTRGSAYWEDLPSRI